MKRKNFVISLIAFFSGMVSYAQPDWGNEKVFAINKEAPYTAILIAPKNVGFERFVCKKLKLITVPSILHLWIFSFYLDYIWLKQKI